MLTDLLWFFSKENEKYIIVQEISEVRVYVCSCVQAREQPSTLFIERGSRPCLGLTNSAKLVAVKPRDLPVSSLVLRLTNVSTRGVLYPFWGSSSSPRSS